MQYSARIKTEAILRLGFYSTLKTVKKWLKKPISEKPDSAIRSLENSVRRMKEQMRESITAHFTDYKENLKYQYFFKLVEAMSGRLYEALIDRTRAFTGSLLDMKGLMENERVAKDQLVEQFASMQRSLKAALDHIGEVEGLVESLTPS
jgi:hypothetical protein